MLTYCYKSGHDSTATKLEENNHVENTQKRADRQALDRYMMGDLGGCMTFALMGSMVTRYYTNVLHVNTLVLATLLLV